MEGAERAAILLLGIGEENAAEETGLDTLKWLEARTVVDLIRDEHPQVIATILTTLDSEQAAEV